MTAPSTDKAANHVARRRDTHCIESPEELRAIASPPRQRLVAALEALGVCSVRELASHLGRSPQSLYFHLERLLECGLVQEAGVRPVGRRHETLYRLVARRLRIAGDLDDPAYRDALTETGRSIARAAERDYQRALPLENTRLKGPARNLALHHYHAHLRPDDKRHVVQVLEELAHFLIDHNDPGRGELLSYTSFLAPVPPRPSKETA